MYALIERHLPPGWSLIRGARLLRVDEQPFPNQSVACGMCMWGAAQLERGYCGEPRLTGLSKWRTGTSPLRRPPLCPVLSSDHVPSPLPCPDTTRRHLKGEADLLLVDPNQVVQAVLEVKTASGNPFLALYEDVTRCGEAGGWGGFRSRDFRPCEKMLTGAQRIGCYACFMWVSRDLI